MPFLKPASLARRFWRNMTLHELSGSLGDLGTLLPVMISLAVSGQINLTSTLWFTGLWNILSGIMFQVPVCVQPMKAIAAVVLSSNMSIEENMSAGLSVGMFIFFLGATRTIHIVGNYTPVPVVRGLQLGTGIQLIRKAQGLVANLQWKIVAENWADNYTWVLLSFIFVFSCYRTRIPTALILFLIGLLFALIRMFVTDTELNLPHPVAAGHYPDTIVRPTPIDFGNGFVNAGLGQIPLTTLNSVIALCALIDDLFPDKHASPATVSMSIGIMNLIGCWFGAMPVCHGAGGLAGQYRFGARTEVSVIVLGAFKLFFGILFGSSLVGLLQVFPKSILAVMLFVSGVELACAVRVINRDEYDEERKRENWTIMLVTMGALVGFSNDGIGFLTGLVAAVLLSVQRLGVRLWFQHTWTGFRELPQRWKDQKFDDKGRALPTSSQLTQSPSTNEPLENQEILVFKSDSDDSTKNLRQEERPLS